LSQIFIQIGYFFSVLCKKTKVGVFLNNCRLPIALPFGHGGTVHVRLAIRRK